MKKLIKRIKCPECGAEYKGFWVNPICTCGHQLRELTTTEAAWSNIDEYDTIQEKRSAARAAGWNIARFKLATFMDIPYVLMAANFIVKIFLPVESTLGLVMLIGAIIMGVYMALDWIYALIKTIYFKNLESKDDKYFAAQGEQ